MNSKPIAEGPEKFGLSWGKTLIYFNFKFFICEENIIMRKFAKSDKPLNFYREWITDLMDPRSIHGGIHIKTSRS